MVLNEGRNRTKALPITQAPAGYFDARPQADKSTKTSCDARPDHTSGSRVGPRALSLIGRRGAKQLRELVEVRGRDVGDSPVCDPVLDPTIHVISVHRAWYRCQIGAARRGYCRKAYEMLAVTIDQRRHREFADNVDPSADQREILFGEIDNPRRLRDAPVEPGFHRVAVGRCNVDWL